MNQRLLLVLAALSSLFFNSQSLAEEKQLPVPLIFDTDIGNDVDDVLALGMIHSLQSRGHCQLLAVTITKDHPLAGKFVDGVNTFYGRGNIPIGVAKGGITPGEGKFLGLTEKRDNDRLRYPHDFDPATASDAVVILRQALAKATGASVVIAQVGFSSNLARLLSSQADRISPMTGKELVKKKVKLLSIMAGAFELIPNSQGERTEYHEYNVVKDLSASKLLTRDWPTPIVWSGYEVGLAVSYPATSIEQDYSYSTHHPLPEAYYLYSPPPHNRPSWDLTSVLYGVFPGRNYFDLSTAGTVTVNDEGLTAFTVQASGKHRYLIMSSDQQIRVREALVQLASQPPTTQE